MRVNNVSTATSAKTVVVMSIIVAFIVAGLIIAYIIASFPDISLLGFFKWLFVMFQTLREECSDEPIIPWLILILPLCCFALLIGAIISRNNALKLFNTGLNIKYVDFLPDRLEFCFTKPEYNFVCTYSDVEKLDMNIKSQLVHTKNGSYIAFEQLNLIFSILNNKKFELYNTPISPIKTIYKIIDYTRGVQKFHYYFTGVGEVPDYREKIEKYLESGYKDLFGNSREKQMMLTSLIFFLASLFIICPFIQDIIKDPMILVMFFPLLLFALIWIVIDIILVIDKIRDYKYATFHPQADLGKMNFVDKITIWHLLIVKLIVLLVLGYLVLMPVISSNIDKKIFNKSEQMPQVTSYRVLDGEGKQYTDRFVDLRINAMSDYDYMSKRDIFDMRKRYVSESLFAKADYEPSEHVFGQIADNKPWWGDTRCDILNYTGDYSYHIDGDSKLSTMINNPNLVVGIFNLFLPWDDPYYGDYCTAEYSKYIPISLKYREKDNLFVAKYYIQPEFTRLKINVTGINGNRNIPLRLAGINALDFGYKYIWASDSKNISMLYPNESNVLTDVQEFYDFIHLGGSCQYQDGCNNLSPMQNGLTFTITNLPAEIDLKLWKKNPANKNSKADVYFKMVFE